MLVMLVIYFRYVMGFFMRNFERQADLYSARIMGTPQHTITSLEKIALFSGKSRHIPSWHHFSIKERVDYLLKTIRHPRLERRHHRFVAVSFLVYLIGLGGLGYFLNFSSAKDQLTYRAVESALSRQLLSDPHNTSLRHNLAMIYHQTGQYAKAIEAYDQIIMRDPDHSASLNNLAWILVTAPREELRDNGRALALAKRAVALERSAVFLDTLAEAYYANGQIQEAVRTIKSAIGLATEDRSYYRRQLKKFQTPEDR
jgi:tetratricopeptide (TPR) repeat protein